MTTYPDGTLLRISPSSIGSSVAVSLGNSIAVNPGLSKPVTSAEEWLAICMGMKGATPSVDAFLAISIADGNTDRPIPHITYPSVEAWLATIPGADISQLDIQVKVKEKVRAKTRTAWKVPPARSNFRWARHVYTMIHESGCKTDEVREAYHQFMDRLMENETYIRTSAPFSHDKYERGIVLSDDIHASRHGIRDYVHMGPHVTSDRGANILRSIYDAYYPLYLLIKDTVVPYMKQMTQKRRDDYNTALYMRALSKAVEAHQKLVTNYQQQELYLRRHMEKLREKLDAIKAPKDEVKEDSS